MEPEQGINGWTRRDQKCCVTFDPEFLDVGLNAGGFEADAEGGQDEESNEKDFAGVPLDESAQVEEMPLEFRP